MLEEGIESAVIDNGRVRDECLNMVMTRRKPIVLDFVTVEEEVLKPEEYLKLVRENPSIIKSSRLVHPRLGKTTLESFWLSTCALSIKFRLNGDIELER